MPVDNQGTYYEYNINSFPVAPSVSHAQAPTQPQAQASSSQAHNPPPAHVQPPPSTSSQSFVRPSKRPRDLTEEETAAVTRNFTRGDFFVGNSALVRIDPRLPVRMVLGENDQVHFTIGDYTNSV
jgi:hypothetical protein